MGRRLARSAPQGRVELNRRNAWMWRCGGFCHVRDGKWGGMEKLPEGLAISTFPHVLRMWLGSGSEQRLANGARSMPWHAVVSQN